MIERLKCPICGSTELMFEELNQHNHIVRTFERYISTGMLQYIDVSFRCHCGTETKITINWPGKDVVDMIRRILPYGKT